MSEIKILGKNSDFRVVKMGPVGMSQTAYSLSAYAIQSVDHETPGKHYTKRHYQVKLYADPVLYKSGNNSDYPYSYMATLTLHLSGSSDTYVLQQQTTYNFGYGLSTLMLDWRGTIGQGDSLSMLVRRINSNTSIQYNAVFYMQVS